MALFTSKVDPKKRKKFKELFNITPGKIALQQILGAIKKKASPHISEDLDLVIFICRISKKGEIAIVETKVTNRKGDKESIDLSKMI